MTNEQMQMAQLLQAQPPANGAVQGLFGTPPQQLQRMAGDVIPMPITPGPNAGPTMQSARYGYGVANDPQVLPLGPDRMKEWLNRAAERIKPK